MLGSFPLGSSPLGSRTATAVAATGHRYWRVNLLTNRTSYNGYQQLSEIVMAASAGGASLLGAGTASAKSASGGQPASYACDGNINTFWSSTDGNPQWWAYDFGASGAVDVLEVRLTSRDSTLADQDNAPSSLTIDYSDDNITWSASSTFAVGTWTVAETKTFSLAPFVSTLPIRVTQTGAEVWGSNNAPPVWITQAGAEVWLDVPTAPVDPVAPDSASTYVCVMT